MKFLTLLWKVHSNIFFFSSLGLEVSIILSVECYTSDEAFRALQGPCVSVMSSKQIVNRKICTRKQDMASMNHEVDSTWADKQISKNNDQADTACSWNAPGGKGSDVEEDKIKSDTRRHLACTRVTDKSTHKETNDSAPSLRRSANGVGSRLPIAGQAAANPRRQRNVNHSHQRKKKKAN